MFMRQLCVLFHTFAAGSDHVSKDKLLKFLSFIIDQLFTKKFDAPLWRLRLDATKGILAAEVRDGDLLLTHFYTLDTEDFSLRQLPRAGATAWWQGLEDAEDGLVLLHGYGNRQLGQHKGIMACNSLNGEQVWEQPGLAYYGLVAGNLLAYKPDAPEEPLQALALHTGRPSGKLVQQQEAAEAVAACSRSRYSQCQYPILYRQGEPYFADVSAFLEATLQARPVQAIEYAETGANLLMAYYEQEPSKALRQTLAVFDTEGNLTLKVQLGTGLSGIGSDTFFIFKHNLYFILNKDTLQVYRLLA